jgi:hypothetical protein
MKGASVSMRLRALADSLQDAKSLLAWLDLKECERRPGDPPVLSRNTDLALDLQNELSHFLAIAANIHKILNNREKHHLPEKRCAQWRDKILELETEFHRLNLPKSF